MLNLGRSLKRHEVIWTKTINSRLDCIISGKQVFKTMHFNIRTQFRIVDGNSFRNVNDLLFLNFEEI
jgi:hypothetical protein